jgi:hypothetical protein
MLVSFWKLPRVSCDSELSSLPPTSNSSTYHPQVMVLIAILNHHKNQAQFHLLMLCWLWHQKSCPKHVNCSNGAQILQNCHSKITNPESSNRGKGCCSLIGLIKSYWKVSFNRSWSTWLKGYKQTKNDIRETVRLF